MPAPIPLLDVAGYRRRTEIDPGDVDMFESRFPGYIGRKIATGSSGINARLQKRYRTPLGQSAPPLVAVGTSPPAVVLSGLPSVGSVEIAIEVTTPGALGAAVVRWSDDGGETWTSGVTTASTVALGGTGLAATFPAGAYSADNVYRAPTPVPEIVLGWAVAGVDVAVWRKRGTNPADPAIEMAIAALTQANDEIKEAADSKDGLYELPTNDRAGDTAQVRGGPLFYSESSPFVSADRQEADGVQEDARGYGTFGGR